MAKSGRVVHLAREAFSHYKTIGACGIAVEWLRTVALPGEIKGDGVEGVTVGVAQGLVLCASDTEAVASLFTETFLGEVAKHRAWDRDVSRIAT